MQPERRLVFDLHDQCGTDHDGARDHDDEDRRAVAGIDEGIVEPADVAVRTQVDEPGVKLALAAAWTAAGNAAQRALGYRRCGLVHLCPSSLAACGRREK